LFDQVVEELLSFGVDVGPRALPAAFWFIGWTLCA